MQNHPRSAIKYSKKKMPQIGSSSETKMESNQSEKNQNQNQNQNEKNHFFLFFLGLFFKSSS